MRFRDFMSAPGRDAVADADTGLAPVDAQQCPAVLQSADSSVDLAEWAGPRVEDIHRHLYRSGAVLFRNFAVNDATDFERAVRTLAGTGELMNYVENTSPRTTVLGNVKTSTDHPADQAIPLHNEHSFSDVFPAKLFFCCMRPAAEGGETPLADCRAILRRLPGPIRDRFRQKGGYLYVRNFGNGFGPEWPDVFHTADRVALERYLTGHAIEFEWRDGEKLQVRYRRATEATHPVTREAIWFNHALFWHVSSLEPSIRDLLLASFGEGDLPNHSLYGDGSPIEPEVIGALREAYARETVLMRWERGDVLLADNLLVAHGRQPYSGARLVLFAMADPWTREQVTAPPGS